MSNLPVGWAAASIGELVTLNPKNEVDDGTLVGFVPMSRLGVDFQSPVTYEPRLWSGVKRGYTHFADGDVLLAKITPCFENGKAGLVRDLPNGLGAGSTEYHVSRPKLGCLEARYLLAFFKTEHFVKEGALQMTGSVGQKRVPKAYLLETGMPLAPLSEQTRIADKLDAVLARVNTCRGRLDRVPGILKRFRQSVLAAATSGKLTEDWRAEQVARMQPQAESGNVAHDAAELCYHVISPLKRATASDEVIQRLEERRHSTPSTRKFKEPVAPDMTQWKTDIPDGWSVESISAYADCLDYMRVPVTKGNRASTQGLYPYYGANGQVDSVDEFLFDDELVLVNEDETFYGREKPIAYRTSGRCWVNNHAHVLLAGNVPRADYLCFALMYYDVLPWLTGTTGRAKLTQGVLNALPIAVPPQIEIEEIVRRVESLFAYADRLEAHYKTARAKVEKLTPALLAKAFRGELVPQDPNDEPAAVLLARIRAGRGDQSAHKPKRGRKAVTV